MSKLNFLGWHGRGNLGDDAFRVALENMMPQHWLEFTSTKIVDGSTVILGPGEVCKPFYLETFKPMLAFGVGFGYESEIDLLPEGCQVWARSHRDVSLLREKGFKASYVPDIALTLNVPKERYLLPAISRRKQKVMAVVLSDHANIGRQREKSAQHSYAEYLKWELASTLEECQKWYDIVFISLSDAPHAQDYRMGVDVASRMNNPPPVFQQVGLRSTLQILSQMDMIVSMKFHGLIFSMIAGKPFVNIGITRKTTLLCREGGLPDLSVDPYSFTLDGFLLALKCAEEPATIPRIVVLREQARKRVYEAIQELDRSVTQIL